MTTKKLCQVIDEGQIDQNDDHIRPAEKISSLQAKSSSDQGLNIDSTTSSQINQPPSDGNPLSEKDQSWYGSRFGADFSGVRIHTGPKAEELTQAIHAKAFTIGNDIFFGKGEYNPDTKDGKKLPAHELTHTIQQGKMGSGVKKVQRKEIAVRDIRKNCKEWFYKKLPEPVAYVKQQKYRYLSFKETYEPLEGQYEKTPVYKYVWIIKNYKAVACPPFDPNGMQEKAVIGLYYNSSVDGKLLPYGGSKSWEEAFTREYNRLRK